ncbi:MAG: LPD7 domain-containing protein [Acidithiobacillus sp.]
MGMNFKSTAHNGAQALGRHLKKSEENEHLEFLSRGCSDEPEQAAFELMAMAQAASKRGTKRPLIHTAISPDETLTAAQWEQAWSAYEKEFRLTGRPYHEARHRKPRADGTRVEHRHRIYPGVDLDRGTVVNLDHNFARQEKLARILEHAFGHDLIKGRFNQVVAETLEAEGQATVAAAMADQGLLDGHPAHARQRPWEHQQQKRTGANLAAARETIAQAWLNAEHFEAFRDNLADAGMALYAGDKPGVPVVMDAYGAVYPLLRTLNQSATVTEQGRIKKAVIEAFIRGQILTPLPSAEAGRPKKGQYKAHTLRETRAVMQDEEAADRAARRQSALEEARQAVEARNRAAAKAEAARLAQQAAQQRAADETTAAETSSGVRHPQQSAWRSWRATVLTDRYGDNLRQTLERQDAYIRIDRNSQSLLIRTQDATVEDFGDRIVATGEGQQEQEIALMLQVARAKGWMSLEFTGSLVFQEQAAIAALRAGFEVADDTLAQRARGVMAEEDRITCQGCAMSLPATLAQAIRRGRLLPENRFSPDPYNPSGAEIIHAGDCAEIMHGLGYRRVLGGLSEADAWAIEGWVQDHVSSLRWLELCKDHAAGKDAGGVKLRQMKEKEGSPEAEAVTALGDTSEEEGWIRRPGE